MFWSGQTISENHSDLTRSTPPFYKQINTGDSKGFYNAVQWINSQPVSVPGKSKFSFEYTLEAALKNSLLMKKYNYDLERAIMEQPNTIISYGSEVRPIQQLEVLLHHHPNFTRFSHNMTHGISYPIKELDEDMRIRLLKQQLEKGNHKSTNNKEDKIHVTKAMETDVTRGFGLILTRTCVERIKQAEIYPLGLQHQMTINERGEHIPKKRVCHDLSNNRDQGYSINQRVIEERVPSVLFGYTFLRFLHMIHHIRFFNPNERILINKVDIEKAYRRLHTSAKMTAKCIAMWFVQNHTEDHTPDEEEIAVALGRLPFGSMPAPAEFSNSSDITFDLVNDLLNCPLWDPTKLPSPLKNEIPPPKRLSKEVPFGPAFAADVQLPISFKGGTDGYIDDGTACVLDTEENKAMVQRAEQCITMALHLQFRPNAGKDEPIQRAEMASMRKLKAEAFLTEVMDFLGWEIDTRRFTVALPNDKHTIWSNQIKEMLTSIKAPYKELASLIGRLNHVAFIIPSARHFMNRLRKLETKAAKFGSVKITAEARKDLKLWLKFLLKANRGISINNIIFRKVTSLNLSDSCEMGIGGYGHHSGMAWRYEFTKEEQISFDINQKEYLASSINQKIQLTFDDSQFPCSEDITDNTSACAWMYKSNFDPSSHPVNNEIARETAKTLMEHNASSYSQHLPGAANDIADSLSRDFHLTDKQLIALFEHTKPPYLPPQKMKIIKLPEEITSWIASLAQLTTKKRELKWARTRSTLAHGIIGWSGSTTSKPDLTPIFKSSHVPKKYDVYVDSYMRFEEEISLPPGIKLRGRQRKRPLFMWLRPSQQVVGRTQD
jgi:LysM repeat protein